MSFLDRQDMKELRNSAWASETPTIQVKVGVIEDMLDEIGYLEKEADWLAARMECDNDFTAEQEVACIKENGPCAKCLREAARRNVRG